MIGTALIVGAAIIAGVGLLARFWNDITSWLKKAINKVAQVTGAISYGVTVFVRKISEGLKEISNHYTKKQNQWEETIVTKTIPENEVPKEIREKASTSYDTDITAEYELQLSH